MGLGALASAEPIGQYVGHRGAHLAVLMARLGPGNDLGHGSLKTVEPGLGRDCRGESAAARQVLGATQAELGQGAKVGRAR